MVDIAPAAFVLPSLLSTSTPERRAELELQGIEMAGKFERAYQYFVAHELEPHNRARKLALLELNDDKEAAKTSKKQKLDSESLKRLTDDENTSKAKHKAANKVYEDTKNFFEVFTTSWIDYIQSLPGRSKPPTGSVAKKPNSDESIKIPKHSPSADAAMASRSAKPSTVVVARDGAPMMASRPPNPNPNTAGAREQGKSKLPSHHAKPPTGSFLNGLMDSTRNVHHASAPPKGLFGASAHQRDTRPATEKPQAGAAAAGDGGHSRMLPSASERQAYPHLPQTQRQHPDTISNPPHQHGSSIFAEGGQSGRPIHPLNPEPYLQLDTSKVAGLLQHRGRQGSSDSSSHEEDVAESRDRLGREAQASMLAGITASAQENKRRKEQREKEEEEATKRPRTGASAVDALLRPSPRSSDEMISELVVPVANFQNKANRALLVDCFRELTFPIFHDKGRDGIKNAVYLPFLLELDDGTTLDANPINMQPPPRFQDFPTFRTDRMVIRAVKSLFASEIAAQGEGQVFETVFRDYQYVSTELKDTLHIHFQTIPSAATPVVQPDYSTVANRERLLERIKNEDLEWAGQEILDKAVPLDDYLRFLLQYSLCDDGCAVPDRYADLSTFEQDPKNVQFVIQYFERFIRKTSSTRDIYSRVFGDYKKITQCLFKYGLSVHMKETAVPPSSGGGGGWAASAGGGGWGAAAAGGGGWAAAAADDVSDPDDAAEEGEVSVYDGAAAGLRPREERDASVTLSRQEHDRILRDAAGLYSAPSQSATEGGGKSDLTPQRLKLGLSDDEDEDSVGGYGGSGEQTEAVHDDAFLDMRELDSVPPRGDTLDDIHLG